MKASIPARLAAAAVALFVTLGTVDLLAAYAYPTQPAVMLASSAR